MFVAKLLITSIIVLTTFVGKALAADYPNRPVRLLVPYAAGGGTDITARFLAERLTKHLGQPVIVENRTGASGLIATAELARAPADGYTIILQTATPAAIAPQLQKNLTYDHVDDIQPLTLVAKLPNVMIINKEIPAKTLPEFLEWVKERPGKVSFGSGGVGGNTHIEGEMVNKMAGVNMVHIPYRGAAPALQDLIAGRIHMLFDNVTGLLPHIKAGTVRALAVTTAEPVGLLPEVPSIVEAGLPHEFAHSSWIAFFTRAGVPDEVLSELERALLATQNEPETIARLNELGGIVSPLGINDLDKFWRSELDYWKEIIALTEISMN